MTTLKLVTVIIILFAFVEQLSGQSYENTFKIFDDLLNSSVYKPQVRPISDQSQTLNVSVEFNLVSIVTVDESTESFICNGFMAFNWRDERLQWTASDYGNQDVIHPFPKEIWRPRVVLVNTLGESDIFADDISVLFVRNTGHVLWSPGSLFTTSCSLNLQKYPFDEQQCQIQMYSMGLSASQLLFKAGKASLDFFTVNGEWDLLNIWIESSIAPTDDIELSIFKVQFRMKRRPMFYLLNIILPAVILSVLNLLVFCIPQESGEKIGYGITVLLALSVFFSIIGGMLPRSSNVVPFVVIYLFTKYLIASLAVLDSILISYIYHIDEKQENCNMIGNLIVKFTHLMRRRRKNIVSVGSDENTTIRDPADSEKKTMKNQFSETLKRPEVGEPSLLEEKELDRQKERERETQKSLFDTKALACIIDRISAVVFLAVWAIITLWFFVSVV